MRELWGAAQAVEKGIEAQEIGDSRLVYGLPHATQLRARATPVALQETGGRRHCIDGAGAGRADPADLELLVLEQAIENTPGEGAVRAAALECKINPNLPSK